MTVVKVALSVVAQAANARTTTGLALYQFHFAPISCNYCILLPTLYCYWQLYSVVIAIVSEPPHHDTQQHAVPAIIVSSTTASSFQTNIFCQTFLQHCSAICLELSANICSELQLPDII